MRKITLSLEHERGRRARPPTELELALSQPAWQPAQILGLLREKLDRMTLTDPVIAVALLAPETVAQPAASATLFPEPGGTAEDQARLLDLLSARLGRARAPRPAPGRPPARSRQCLGRRAASARRRRAAAGAAGPSFWLLDPPQPLRLAGDRPQYRGQALRLMRGPERIESGWWDPQLTVRDYFVAEDEAARATGSTASATPSTRAGSCTGCTPDAGPRLRPTVTPSCARPTIPPTPGTPSAAGYAELHCQSNSFLQGASHPEELAARAAELGYAALAITDECSLAGVVRAHMEAKKLNLPLLIGACFQLRARPTPRRWA